jgi:hypothetical protein
MNRNLVRPNYTKVFSALACSWARRAKKAREIGSAGGAALLYSCVEPPQKGN